MANVKMSEAAWLRPTKMSEAAWLRHQNVRGCLAPSSKCPRLPGSVTKMSEAAWLRHTLKLYISMATVWNLPVLGVCLCVYNQLAYADNCADAVDQLLIFCAVD